MRLTMKERKAVTKGLAGQYRRARKANKKILLNSFTEATTYNRHYVAWLLRSHDREIFLGRQVVLRGDLHKRVYSPRERVYDETVLVPLTKVWEVMDYPCGKRLVSVIALVLENLARHRRIRIGSGICEKLCRTSAATVDRLLSKERKKYVLKGRSHTKPGTLLKHQIPVRTFSDWDEKRAGFVEIDLVGHDGGNVTGEFGYTLDMTDVHTAWTETEAVRNKAQVWVFEAMKRLRARLPFDLFGIDSDNGSEFINAHFFRYCKVERITFTRGRAYKKNDGCYVEQKNYSVVRRAVGYARYDTEKEIGLLNLLYGHLRLYTNYFQPTMKLIEKVRNGANVRKRYDAPRTPYQRVLDSPDVPEEKKEAIREVYRNLDLFRLKQEITSVQETLEKSVTAKRVLRERKKGVESHAGSLL